MKFVYQMVFSGVLLAISVSNIHAQSVIPTIQPAVSTPVISNRLEQPNLVRSKPIVSAKDSKAESKTAKILGRIQFGTQITMSLAAATDLTRTGLGMGDREASYTRNYVSNFGVPYKLTYVPGPNYEADRMAAWLHIQNNKPAVVTLGAAGDFGLIYLAPKVLHKFLPNRPILRHSIMIAICAFGSYEHAKEAATWTQTPAHVLTDRRYTPGGPGPYPLLHF